MSAKKASKAAAPPAEEPQAKAADAAATAEGENTTPPAEEAPPFDHTAAHALDTRFVPDAPTAEQVAAGKAAVAKQEHGWGGRTTPDTVMVRVGPNGAAGRIVLGGAVYDGQTPRRMARSDFERLRAQYDLVEVQAS